LKFNCTLKFTRLTVMLFGLKSSARTDVIRKNCCV
jgi:hypothetical protein